MAPILQSKDFSQPQRMGWEALIVLFVNFLKKSWNEFLTLIVFLMMFIGSSNSMSKFILFMIGIMLLTILIGILDVLQRYFFSKYWIKDGKLVFRHGWLYTNTEYVSLAKVHAMRTKNGPLYQLVDMVGISFDTLKSENAEVELILTLADWNALQKVIELEGISDTDDIDVEENRKEESVITFPFTRKQLLLGALSQNFFSKGFVAIVTILGYFLGKIADVGDFMKRFIYWVTDKVALYSDINILSEWTSHFMVYALCILLLFFFILICWCILVCIRYYHLEFSLSSKGLSFCSGFFTRTSHRFTADKIASVDVKQNMLERVWHLHTIFIRQAANVAGLKRKNEIKIYGWRQWRDVVDWSLNVDTQEKEQRSEVHSGRGKFWRGFISLFLLFVLVPMVVLFISINEIPLEGVVALSFLAVLGLCLAMWQGILTKEHSYIILYDDFIEVGYGAFAQYRAFFRYNEVETVRLSHTLTYRFYGRVNLFISTKGPHFVLHSLKEDEAILLFEKLVRKGLCSKK